MEDYSAGVRGGFGNCFSVETLINMRCVLHYFQVESSEQVWQKKKFSEVCFNACVMQPLFQNVKFGYKE